VPNTADGVREKLDMTFLQTGSIDYKELARTTLDVVRSETEINRGRPVFLSRIGLQLAKHYRRPFKYMIPGLPLADFIRTYLSNRVELLEDTGALGYLVRLKDAPDQPTAPPMQSPEKPISPPATFPSTEQTGPPIRAIPRYEPSFWACFAKPLEPPTGFKRVVNLEPPFSFEPIPEHLSVPEGFLEIDAELIAPKSMPPGPGRSMYVVEQIEKWLKQHNLPPEQFFQRSHHPSSKTEERTASIVALLSKLDPKDLERISIPTDIWLKLINL
jgi:hypothetical protein